MGFPKYSDYKDTEIELTSSVPAHWNIRKLKFMASVQNGRDYKHVESDEGYDVIGSGGPFVKASEYLYSGESVLLGRKGTIDEPLYINDKFWTVDTMFYTVIHEDTVAKYLYYCAKILPFKYLSTQTALPSVTQFALENFYITYPEKNEQEKIVDFLDYKTRQIDQLIEKKKALIEKLDEQRIAVITQAVTKGINENAKMKPSGVEWLGDIPEHWEIRRLKFMASIQNGKDYKDIETEADGFPVYGSGGAFKRATNYLYDGESVLFGRKGTIDKPLYVNEKFWTVDTMFYSKILEGTIAKFLYYSAETFQYKLLATQTALPSITQHDLENYILCFPSMDEQNQIVAYVDSSLKKIAKMKRLNRKAISKLEEYRSALITSAVTGKIDTRNIKVPQGE